MFTRVDDVFCNVDDMDQAVAFCRGVLALPVRFLSDDGSDLDAGNVTIALRRFGSGPEGRLGLGVGKGATIVFEVEDIEATRAELEGRGVQFAGDVFEVGPVKFSIFEDPNGNVLRIYQCVR